MAAIFGGGSAKREAERSRRLQEVANDQQLAALNRGEKDAGFTRRRPRGRRLFADAADQDMKAVLA